MIRIQKHMVIWKEESNFKASTGELNKEKYIIKRLK